MLYYDKHSYVVIVQTTYVYILVDDKNMPLRFRYENQ